MIIELGEKSIISSGNAKMHPGPPTSCKSFEITRQALISIKIGGKVIIVPGLAEKTVFNNLSPTLSELRGCLAFIFVYQLCKLI